MVVTAIREATAHRRIAGHSARLQRIPQRPPRIALRPPRVRRRPKGPLFQVKFVNEIQVVIVPHTNRVAAKPP